MANAFESIDIPATPEQVWQLIGGFDSLPDWLPYIPESALSEGGRVRTLANPSGEAIVERLLAFDDAGRSYSYAILQAPFPVTGYRSTLRVRDAEGGARVEWSGQFTPLGVSDDEAARLFGGIYRDGLEALSRNFPAHQEG
ncbi:SRPBCC family protein [Massilia niastensis]|uniref:SRPBCC family protein n=1 Tax=Massilia niastensis TaxID=544911 RepID=UPI0003685D49|nr:SRPBCC family protein [Massilia niastensis]